MQAVHERAHGKGDGEERRTTAVAKAKRTPNDGRRAGGGRTADPQAVTGVAARVVGTGAWFCHRTPTRKASDFGESIYTLLRYK
jgi:hypothetical protein